MARTRMENGVEVALSEAEEIARDAEEKLWADEQTELAKTKYQRDRRAEYPDYRDYLDAIVKGDEAQKQKYINDCLAVKAKYPKG